MRRERGHGAAGFARRAAALGLSMAVLWCVLAASPGMGAGLFDDNEARKQIAAERQRIDDLKSDLKNQQHTVDTRIDKLEEALKSQALLDLFTQIEALKLEVNKLRGQIEVLNNNIETANKRQRDMYLDLDTRLRRFEQQGTPGPAVSSAPGALATAPVIAPPPTAGATPAPGAAAKPPATTAATGQVPTAVASVMVTGPDNVAENRAYEAAQEQRRIGNYQGAIVAFQNFIKQYPKSSLAPRAQYWIGDSYFNLRDFKLAVASQQALVKNYPDSPTIPDAMLNIASSQIEMGESSAGRKMLDELVAKFPISEAADKAKRRLAAFNTPAASKQ